MYMYDGSGASDAFPEKIHLFFVRTFWQRLLDSHNTFRNLQAAPIEDRSGVNADVVAGGGVAVLAYLVLIVGIARPR